MELRTRLASGGGQVAYPPAGGRHTAPPGASSLDQLFPGQWLENELGRCFVVRQSYDLSHVHGLDPLGSFLGAESEYLARLCNEPGVSGTDLSSAIFLDTETTGLEKASTTLVFLVGVAYFHGGRFHVAQFFMDDPAQEGALLRAVGDLLAEFSLLVTFNGKTFDMPMLDYRYELSRLTPPSGREPHADLLYTSRRLWKERLESVRLTRVEREILHIRRTGDVPGRLIPELYRRYVAGRDARPLQPVFYHNGQDLLSLVALATHACMVYADPFGGRVETGADYLSLGKTYDRTGEEALALKAFDRGLAMPEHPAIHAELCRRITPLYKRAAQREHAVALWEEMVASSQARGIFPYEELAKHYEHEQGRYDRAEEMVVRALALLPGDHCTRTSRRELEKRLRRVREKRAADGG